MTGKLKLTKKRVETMALPAEGRITYQDAGDRFLHLVLTRTGRSWRYIRWVNGKTVFMTLGKCPPMTPEQARKASTKTSAAYAAGGDPQQDKKNSRNLATWSDLFLWFMETHSRPHKKTWKYDEQLEGRYCTAWRAWPYTALTAAVISQWHKKIGAEHGRHGADRVLAVVKKTFAEALAAQVIKGENPAAAVRKFYSDPRKYGRDRYLQGDELAPLFKALDEFHDQNAADFFRLAIFTGARRSNLQSMRWADMDRSNPGRPTWRIPADQSKNAEPVVVPLLIPALEVLNRRYEKRKSDVWVFPSRLGAKCPHYSEPKRAWASICAAAKIENCRLHDLRRTLGSWQALLGASLQIIGKSLGHRNERSTLVYARLKDLDPVRHSMDLAVTRMLAAANGGDKNEGTK